MINCAQIFVLIIYLGIIAMPMYVICQSSCTAKCRFNTDDFECINSGGNLITDATPIPLMPRWNKVYFLSYDCLDIAPNTLHIEDTNLGTKISMSMIVVMVTMLGFICFVGMSDDEKEIKPTIDV